LDAAADAGRSCQRLQMMEPARVVILFELRPHQAGTLEGLDS
jgi:hypothetical protein